MITEMPHYTKTHSVNILITKQGIQKLRSRPSWCMASIKMNQYWNQDTGILEYSTTCRHCFWYLIIKIVHLELWKRNQNLSANILIWHRPTSWVYQFRFAKIIKAEKHTYHYAECPKREVGQDLAPDENVVMEVIVHLINTCSCEPSPTAKNHKSEFF